MAQKRTTTRQSATPKRHTAAKKTTTSSSSRTRSSVKKTIAPKQEIKSSTTPTTTTSPLSRFSRKQISLVIGIIVVIGLLYLLSRILIAALVNGQPISRLTVIHQLEQQNGKRALDSLITQKLIEDEASKRNITVSQQEIDNQTKTIEKNIQSQGATLDQALAQQGMTRKDLTDQLRLQLLVNKMVGTPNVTDKEIADFIKTNQQQLPQGQSDATVKNQVKQQLIQQKQQQLSQTFVQNLRSKAHITYFVNYQ